MFPEILNLKLFTPYDFPIHTYGVLLALGFGAGFMVATILARETKISAEDIQELCVVALVSGMIGARLLYAAIEWDQFAENPLSVLYRRDGFVFYGGLLLAIPLCILFVRRKKLDVRRTADVMAPALAIGHSIGRLGCFAQGCCYGRPSEWGVVFDPKSLPSYNLGEVPVIPTQLYESLLLLLLFGILLTVRKKMRLPGELFLVYLLGYAVIRFGIENFRADPRGFSLGPFSISQAISLAVAAVAAGLLIAWRRRRATS